MGKRKRLHIISVSEVQQQPIEVEHPSEKNLSDQSNLIHFFFMLLAMYVMNEIWTEDIELYISKNHCNRFSQSCWSK